MNDSILRIMISTDNHLGFAEKDDIRGDDSFASFEEVFVTAKSTRADLVLFAGDMFHENKPSRNTIYNTIDLLQHYCLGNEPVYTEILNEQYNLKTMKKGVNFEDPNISVSLPVFSIHGNHDDPAKDCSRLDSLSALDLLEASNLINYFGKADKVDDIEITPILIRKEEVYVALYGLGAIRDERLNRMWNQQNVKFVRPTEDQGKFKYLNIFVLHQNRDSGRGSKNCIHESMIPEWMDLVIWGNEHECIPKLVESLVGTYRIYQPGSSVATSFSERESLMYTKSMGLIEIRKSREFRLTAFPYKNMRLFKYSEIVLSECENLNPHDSNIEEKIKNILSKEVTKLIKEARSLILNNIDENNENNSNNNKSNKQKFKIKNPEKVLIRLRVDHTNFLSINSKRLGNLFLQEVANPFEMILFSKTKMVIEKMKKNENLVKILKEGTEEETNKIKIEDLVAEKLKLNNKSLQVIDETGMAKALDDFVVKKSVHSINDFVTETLTKFQRDLLKGNKKLQANMLELNLNLSESKPSTIEKPKRKTTTKTTTTKRKKDESDDEDEEECEENDFENDNDFEEEEEEKNVKKKTNSKTSKTTNSTKAKPSTSKTTSSKRKKKEESDDEDENNNLLSGWD